MYSELTMKSNTPIPMHPIPPTTIATYVMGPGKNETKSKKRNPSAIAHTPE